MVMSALTWSIYLFYRMYITWKHYRDHTGEEVFPVWHALATGLPIYGYFRVHAHARSYKELIARADIPNSIDPRNVVIGVIAYSAVGYIENSMAWGEITQTIANVLLLMDILSVVIVAWLLLHLQENINRYWYAVSNGALQDARFGVGEVILAILGVLLWFDTFSNVLSSEYRSGYEFATTLVRCCVAG